MTSIDSQDHTMQSVDQSISARPAGGGKALAGMWWVAWRQHRAQLAISMGGLAVVAVVLLIFRIAVANRLSELTSGYPNCDLAVGDPTTQGCPGQAYSVLYGDFGTTWGLLRMGILILPLVLGAFVGAPLFAREFEQHTQVFALTQSVGRLRWWATKIVVAAVPVVLGMVGLGLMVDWVAAPYSVFSYGPMDTPGFETRGIIPAAFTVLTIALGVTSGIVLRSTVISLVVTLVVAGLLVVALGLVRPHLLAPTRVVTPVVLTAQPDQFYPDGQSWYLDHNYLDANGTPVAFVGDCPALSGDGPTSPSDEDVNREWAACLQKQGITSEYTDYLPSGRRWPLQGLVAGITTILSGLVLAAGALRLRRRVL
ncbi:MAG: hypothetical protein ABJD68_10605 [Nakamurella sp.]